MAALKAARHPSGTPVYDMTRVFIAGCSEGSAFSIFAADCVHAASPSIITAFATHSGGLHVKGDGLTFPPDTFNPQFRCGDCPDCEYFPTVPRRQPRLKACVFDNTGDILPNFGDFYNSSVNMVVSPRRTPMHT